MTTYTSRITEITVFPEKEGMLSEGAVSLKLIDEGGGEFLELSQDGEHIRLDFEELPLLVAAAEKLQLEGKPINLAPVGAGEGRPVEGQP